MKSSGYLNNAKGAVAPLVAIMLVVIIVCVAVVVDLGHIHNVKIQLQRAVDAAALAGANKLNGSAGAVQAAKDEAEAVAAANQVDQDSVIIVADNLVNPSDPDSSHFVELGTWDREALGSAASSRFVATEDSPNAVKVTAIRTVNHVFFFFVPGTDITVDAIAVARPKVPILPLAVVTCIPAEEMIENPGSLPDMTVCGITAYSLDPDQDDTAAWTSLTLGASASDIIGYMESDEGREIFNKVVFGKGLTPANGGIENEPVDSIPSPFDPDYGGCFPQDFNINCGLGRINGEDLAADDDFPIPPNLSDLSLTHGEPAPGFDPLTDFGTHADGALPRWYNLNNDNSFDSDDYFSRVWTQDGILIRREDGGGTLESLSDYFTRLKGLAECADSSCRPYGAGDDRFLDGNFIVQPNGQFANNLNDALGVTPEYWPDFLAVVNHAGYPKVGVINGNATNVLKAFIENEDVTGGGTNLKCSDNEPFPAGEKTLRVNAPVIFAGSCENWKAISNASSEHTLVYVGLAKLLLTRAWVKNNESYDCGDDSEVVQLHGGEGCSASDFDPTLNGGTYFSVPVSVPSSLKAIEGLTLVPTSDDEDDQGSLLEVYLVE